jgi:enoyl-[acyl-carrier protein] reductase I
LHYQQRHAPMRRSPTLDEVGGAALYLLSDLSGAVTGEIHFVDCGYSTIAMPNISALKTAEQNEEGSEAPVEKAPREAAQ